MNAASPCISTPITCDALDVAPLALLGAHLAHHHRVHRLEMRGVGREREVDVLAVGQVAIGRGAEMVLHVTRAQNLVIDRVALELREDGGVGLAHHVGENVEAPAMRHAEHDLLHTEARRRADDGLERRDGALAAVEAESLGARELDLEELLEALRLGELLEDGPLVLGGRVEDAARALDPGLDPALLIRLLDVQELDADGRAVRLLQHLHDLTEGRLLEAQHVVEIERPVEVGVGEAVGAVVELGMMVAAGEAQSGSSLAIRWPRTRNARISMMTRRWSWMSALTAGSSSPTPAGRLRLAGAGRRSRGLGVSAALARWKSVRFSGPSSSK